MKGTLKVSEASPITVRYKHDAVRELQIILQRSYGITQSEYLRDALDEKLERDNKNFESSVSRYHIEFANSGVQTILNNIKYTIELDDFMQNWVQYLLFQSQMTPLNLAIFKRSGCERDIDTILNTLKREEPLIYNKIRDSTVSLFKKRVYGEYFYD